MTADAASLKGLRRHNPLRGILYLSGGAFAFSIHDVAVKLLSGDYPVTEIMFVRSLSAMPLMLLLVHFDAGIPALWRGRTGILLARSMILLIAYLAYYMAFAALPFTDAVALYMTVPLIIAALSGPLLGERVSLLSWLAVSVGFVGVIIMLRPWSGLFEPAGLLILLCALLYSIGMIMARGLSGSIPGTVMASYTTFIFLFAAAVLGPVFSLFDTGEALHPSIAFLVMPWSMPGWWDLLIMISCGITAAAGVTGLTLAYREAEANLVASFEYTALIWAAIWGYLVWHEIPGGATVLGAALIVGAGLAAMTAGRTAAGKA